MKLLILTVFCFGINANNYKPTSYAGFRPGLANLCKKFPLGVGECDSKISERDESCSKIGNCLIENEGAVNNKKNYVYPCADNDIECVRKVFGEKCLCHPVNGPAKDPFCTKQYRTFIPFANATVILTDEQVWGMNDAKIRKFYINKKTGYLFLTIEVPALTLTTSKVCIEFHRLGKETIIKCDRATATYKPLLYTFEFPGVPNCRMDLGRIYAFADSNPMFSLGPNILKSNDPTVKQFTSALAGNLPTLIKERILFQSEIIGAYYMQSNICNFDVKMCYV